MFLLDLHSPGVEIRPVPDLRDIAGDNVERTNEIFLNNVRVPGLFRIGEENRGWYINATLMDFERSGIEAVVRNEYCINVLMQFLKDQQERKGPSERLTLFKHRLVQLKIESDISRLLSYRIAWMQSRKQIPNYQTSMAKIFKTELTKRIAGLGMEILGYYGHLRPDSPQTGPGEELGPDLHDEIVRLYLSTPSGTIAQGTSEIHRNIIAQRGLGLPRN
jgi:alkylation response protein AidB-like acyl-CoA dehydrogenase